MSGNSRLRPSTSSFTDEIAIDDPIVRRYITVLMTLIFKVRRRCLIEAKLSTSGWDEFKDHTIPTK